MRTRTQSLLDDISGMPLLKSVGQDLPDLPDGFMVVRNWSDAMKASNSEAWNIVLLEAQNDITRSLDQATLSGWNECVIHIKSHVDLKIANAIDDLQIQGVRREKLRGRLQWDLMSACLELEYLKEPRGAFFSSLLRWYEIGHFPCGWKGKYPNGFLLIF